MTGEYPSASSPHGPSAKGKFGEQAATEPRPPPLQTFQVKRRVLVWEIERRLAEDASRLRLAYGRICGSIDSVI